MSRRIRWPRNDPRHDGRVSHAQARKSVHAELRVNDRETIHAHFARTDGMSEARRTKPGKFAAESSVGAVGLAASWACATATSVAAKMRAVQVTFIGVS